MTTLVTGATGLLGNNVVRALLAGGHAVRVIVRSSSDPRPLEGLDVERIEGDVRDAAVVKRACEGIGAVIHSAAAIHFGWTGLDDMRAVNVAGTRHVADAALAAGAKMVHVSSVDALAPGAPDAPADEETPGEKVACTYVVTKREAEQVIQDRVKQGLEAVIVNPGFMLGPWDWKPSSGRMMLEVVKRFTPLAPRGGMSICDVRDVAAGVLAALDKGVTGRRYVLAGANISYFDAWRLFIDVAQRGSKPIARAGPLLRILGGAGGDLWARLTGRESDVNSASIKLSSLFHYYSSARAEAELGYRTRPHEQSMRDAWQWFVEHGYV